MSEKRQSFLLGALWDNRPIKLLYRLNLDNGILRVSYERVKI